MLRRTRRRMILQRKRKKAVGSYVPLPFLLIDCRYREQAKDKPRWVPRNLVGLRAGWRVSKH